MQGIIVHSPKVIVSQTASYEFQQILVASEMPVHMSSFIYYFWLCLWVSHVALGQFGSAADTPILLDGGLDE